MEDERASGSGGGSDSSLSGATGTRVDSESPRASSPPARSPFSPFTYTGWQPVMELQISDDITCLLATCDFAPGSPRTDNTYVHTRAHAHTRFRSVSCHRPCRSAFMQVYPFDLAFLPFASSPVSTSPCLPACHPRASL